MESCAINIDVRNLYSYVHHSLCIEMITICYSSGSKFRKYRRRASVCKKFASCDEYRKRPLVGHGPVPDVREPPVARKRDSPKCRYYCTYRSSPVSRSVAMKPKHVNESTGNRGTASRHSRA